MVNDSARLKIGTPVFFTHKLRNSLIPVTEVRSDNPARRLSQPLRAEDALQIALQLRDFPRHETWLDGKPQPVTALRAGGTTLYDLRRPQTFHINNPFHSVHFYFPRAALDAIADEGGVRRIDGLRSAVGMGLDDLVMRSLTAAMQPAFAQPQKANRLFIEHITMAVGVHLASTCCGMRAEPRPRRGGLAPWQETRAKDILAAHLDGHFSLASLARQCGQSTAHFARAFRQSVGMPPHQWLMQRRIDHARTLLLSSPMALSDIALACGFAGQSHFTRAFTRRVGTSPGVCRRQYRN
ncbi:MAG TPA: AraC family transcriptional regulator [Reyranella sp.]